MSDFELETLLQHADATSGSDVVRPIYQASTFAFDDADAMSIAAKEANFERFYTRHGNPNSGAVERVLSEIEGGESAMLTASGMAAISVAAMAVLKSGDHVVAQRAIYPGARALVTQLLPRYGVDVTLVEQEDIAEYESAIQAHTKLVMLETPSNPLLGITDIKAVVQVAHARGAMVSVDNTVATPVNQRPLDLGADIVVHSATKYLGGHSDLIAGAIVTSKSLIERMWQTHVILGATPAPFTAWLLLRGLRTLDLRVRKHNDNAMAVAKFLSAHRRVNRVFYPGLTNHPGHRVAAAQMSGYGGLLSFEIDGSLDDARRVVERLHLVRHAVSLGGVESLVALPASMWPKGGASHSEYGTVPESLIRLSAGLESAADLIADLDAALQD